MLCLDLRHGVINRKAVDRMGNNAIIHTLFKTLEHFKSIRHFTNLFYITGLPHFNSPHYNTDFNIT